MSIYNPYYFIILPIRHQLMSTISKPKLLVFEKRKGGYFEGENQNLLKNIPVVTISAQGIFKYILINCQGHINEKEVDLPQHFVRGDKVLEYHQQNFQKFIGEIKAAGFQIKKKNAGQGRFQAVKGELKLKFTCPGGGRIQHNYGGKKCFIYGYSQSYGGVDHKIAQALVSMALNYPLNEITTSQQGY